jgi:alpha-D-ribose 1-methylphosphonate 5-triphosphate synthase subunit PhnH
VFVTDACDTEEVISGVKSGTLRDPNLSATVILMDRGEGCEPIRLHGPGIDGSMVFQASNAVRRALSARGRQYYEYPQGIDLVFVTDAGKLFAIPRLVMMEVC